MARKTGSDSMELKAPVRRDTPQEKELRRQKARASAIFNWLVIGLLLSTFGWVVFEFGLFGGVPLVQPAATLPPVMEGTPSPGADLDTTPSPVVTTTPPPAATPGAESDAAAAPAAEGKIPVTGTQILTWVFASLVGSITYLLYNLSQWYRRLKLNKPDNEADFLKYTYWYAVTFLNAPFLSVVVMAFLNLVDLQIGADEALSIDFNKMDPFLQSGLAFILGYFSRTTRTQLTLIARALLPRAWTLAENKFMVTGPSEVLLGGTEVFKTEPLTDVVWSVASKDVAIDPTSGQLSAPADLGRDGEKLIVRAALRSEQSLSGLAEATLRALRIVSDSTEISAGQSVTLSLETMAGLPVGQAVWDSDDKKIKPVPVEPAAGQPENKALVTVTAPGTVAEEKELVINARVMKDTKEYRATPVKIKLQKGDLSRGGGG